MKKIIKNINFCGNFIPDVQSNHPVAGGMRQRQLYFRNYISIYIYCSVKNILLCIFYLVDVIDKTLVYVIIDFLYYNR